MVNGGSRTTRANRVMEDGRRAIGDEGMEETKGRRGGGDSESSVYESSGRSARAECLSVSLRCPLHSDRQGTTERQRKGGRAKEEQR